MDILEKVRTQGLILDGGMGSMLIARGLAGGESAEVWNLTRPDVIAEVHQLYYDAGSDVASVNTFGGSALKLQQMKVTETMEDINRAAVRIARSVCKPGQYVAGDIGTLGEMLAPMGPLKPEEAEAAFKEQAAILEDEGVDFFMVETIFDLNLALAAVRAVKSVSAKPVFSTMTFKETPKGFFTIMGNAPEASMKALVDEGASAVGANCSMGSDTMVTLAGQIRDSVDCPVVIQPNAGMPQTGENNTVFYPESEDFFAGNIKKIKDLGVEIVGGCCGTNPDYIRRVKEMIQG
ncbi:MAG: homocysteine S-methyltransferase family protein [Desulfobacterales bacterium]|nr:homocysteine S-methyltransferase family protein [Desulfobacterales bacterium]